MIFASRLNQSVDLLSTSAKVEFKNYKKLRLEFWVICFTCIDSAWGTTKIIVSDENSIFGKDATFNNMVRNVTPYDENDSSMILRNVRSYQENDRSMFLRNSSDFIWTEELSTMNR